MTDPPGTDLVVADGIDSALCGRLWLELPSPTYTGVTTWRGIVPIPAAGIPGWSDSWGGNREFGIVALEDNQVYWFAAVPARRTRRKSTTERRSPINPVTGTSPSPS